jgi:hypothetical protein
MNVGHENMPSFDAGAFLLAAVDDTTPATLESLGAKGGGLVYVRADVDNTVNVTLGGSGVTDGSGWQLEPGDMSPPIVVHPSRVYAIAGTGGANLAIFYQH